MKSFCLNLERRTVTASREDLITSILSCSIAHELQPLRRLPKQAVSYTSLVAAAKHSKDLSATEDKFREREQLCIEDRLGCQEWRCYAGEDGGREGGQVFLTIVSAHSQTLEASTSRLPPHSPFPKARPAPPERCPLPFSGDVRICSVQTPWKLSSGTAGTQHGGDILGLEGPGDILLTLL